MTGQPAGDGVAPTGVRALAARVRRPFERLAAVPGGSVVVLRAFLGFTFTFAGVQKLTDRYFFQASAPGSIQQQLLGSIRTSPGPIHLLATAADHAPVFVGLVIAFGEIAVGLGTLVGLFSRVAALCGALLSLSFFLTVSFHDSPYYYGPDIVFLFAWTALVIGGGGAWSLDALFARQALAERLQLAASGARDAAAERRRAAEVDRRQVVRQSGAAVALAATGLLLAGVGAVLGRMIGPAHPVESTTGTFGPSGTTDPTTSSPGAGGTTPTTAVGSTGAPKGTKLGPTSDVPVGGAAAFTDPKQQIPAFAVQPVKGDFLAFSRICTHEGCTVNWDAQSKDFVCPCHGSVYNGATGAVLNGPAPLPLPRIELALYDGDLYVED